MNKPKARNLKLKVAQGSMGALQKLRGNGDSKRERERPLMPWGRRETDMRGNPGP